MLKKRSLFLSLLLAFVLQIISVDQANACGGFFCNAFQPVNQNAEKIFFAKDAGKIHMHVQINYVGPPVDFGWILPAPSDVETTLSSEALFAALDRLYTPSFFLNYEYDESCQTDEIYEDYPSYGGNSASVDEESNPPPPVQVLSRENIGPYDRAIIQASTVQSLRDWLDANQFAIPDDIDSKLQPYIDLNSAFVVIKLLAGQDAGDIVPLSMTFSGDRPSIPLKPTAVAASNDMGVIVHFLDQHRAVPVNYQHVQINEKAIDWSSYGSNYPDVVSQAIDEAGGKAFVTDYAGPVGDQLPDLMRPYSEAELGEIERITTTSDLFNLSIDRTNPDYQRILLPMLMPPEGISAADYAACPNCYALEEQPLDGAMLAEKIRTEINPIYTDLHSLLTSLPYLTRLYSTLSPSEMIDDPLFSFNPDLEDVAKQHTATAKVICDENAITIETRITLSSGETYLLAEVETTARQDGETIRGNVPAANVIERMMEAGQPEIIEVDQPEIISEKTSTTKTNSSNANDEGCQQAPSSLFSTLLLSLISIIYLRRQKKTQLG
jgi:hypothetical protein